MLPILYQSENFILYSYPLLMGLGWGVAYQVFFALLPQRFSRIWGQILFWGVFVFAWIGAKLFFLLTISEEQSSVLMVETSFWFGGGFVFYGGFLAGIFFLWLYRFLGFPLNREVLWPIVPALVLGHAVGRLGCFLAGCCYGKETDWWWGIYLHGAHRHPTQLIEAFTLFFLAVIIIRARKNFFALGSLYLISYGLIRFAVELLRGDEIRGEWGLFTPSQWISLGLVLGGTLLKLSKIQDLVAVKLK